LKRLAILGSTGSIGRSTLDVVASHPGRFYVAALAASGRDLGALAEQVRRFRPRLVAVRDPEAARALAVEIGSTARVVAGPEGVVEAARAQDVEVVVCGLVGAAGLEPAYAAADAGKTLALANKEALVAGGAFVTRRAAETGAEILPVDSEHNALHQCLRGERTEEVRTLWLTASGGPFRDFSLERLRAATPEEALDHPTWRMGPKITVDSATLMNKGLEVIEAHWLFGLPAERIRVVVHPKSVVHSMVEFVDGSFKAQLGVTDMRHPIQYALTWPERIASSLPPFDPVAAGPLVFLEPDVDRFPALGMAYRALEAGGAAPAVLNAANESAVEAFLAGRIGFLDIATLVERVVGEHGGDAASSLEDVLAADRRARRAARRHLEQGVSR
jgi:1-deoxy-D-xylulose-5-phosphate reductoisomerase